MIFVIPGPRVGRNPEPSDFGFGQRVQKLLGSGFRRNDDKHFVISDTANRHPE